MPYQQPESTPADRIAAEHDVVDAMTDHRLISHLLVAVLGAAVLLGVYQIATVVTSDPATAVRLATVLVALTPLAVFGLTDVTRRRRTHAALTRLLADDRAPAAVDTQYVGLQAERAVRVAQVKRWLLAGMVLATGALGLVLLLPFAANVSGFVLMVLLMIAWTVGVVRDEARGARQSALLAMDTRALEHHDRTT